MVLENPVVSDICATLLSGCIVLSILRVWVETAKRGFFDQKLNRKLVHISIGLVFMLCWPLFSSGHRGAILASLVLGINIIRMLLLGLGIMKDEAIVKSMSRHGDYSLSLAYFMHQGTSQGTTLLYYNNHFGLYNLLENFPHFNCSNL
ncbi:farnesol kinase, chloroplastic-like [Corylus avellana]|uniref:farnesol kinase, chloroplastic-like n=1 Tax=Corylus avellana TaxID=13451 RepID=UPI00286CF589|nr:farnesol kinase, chloroplastic-like [Corylus avellana]